jgi:hypothetical protein
MAERSTDWQRWVEFVGFLIQANIYIFDYCSLLSLSGLMPFSIS